MIGVIRRAVSVDLNGSVRQAVADEIAHGKVNVQRSGYPSLPAANLASGRGGRAGDMPDDF